MQHFLPWKNNQPYDSQNSQPMSLHRTKMVPLHNRESCDPKIILQTSKDSGSKSEKKDVVFQYKDLTTKSKTKQKDLYTGVLRDSTTKSLSKK